jgi:hypothetical protein
VIHDITIAQSAQPVKDYFEFSQSKAASASWAEHFATTAFAGE